jgi:hypothetical protein
VEVPAGVQKVFIQSRGLHQEPDFRSCQQILQLAGRRKRAISLLSERNCEQFRI